MISSFSWEQEIKVERKAYLGIFDEFGLEEVSLSIFTLSGVLFAPGSSSLAQEPGRSELTSQDALYYPHGTGIEPEDVFIIEGERWKSAGKEQVWPLGRTLSIKRVEG